MISPYFIFRHSPQSIGQVLVTNNGISTAIDFNHPSLKKFQIGYKTEWREFENRIKKGGYFLEYTASIVNSEYRAYLKLLMSICLTHLNHLSDSRFVNLQVYNQINKWPGPGLDGLLVDRIEGLDPIYSKQYKVDNYSFCFCMLLSVILRKTFSEEQAGRTQEPLNAITAKEFAKSTNRAVAVESNEEQLDNFVFSWTTDVEPSIYINFCASKLLTLLFKVGDEKSILTLMSNPLFAMQDAASLAKAIELAIGSENQPLLVKLTTMLQGIEPKHPVMGLANSYLRKFELYTRSSLSVDEISKMGGTDFEFALRNALTKHSNFESVEVTPASGDYGADLILTTKQGTRIAVQCKRFSSKVNLKAVQEVVAAIKHYGCDLGVVISNNGFLNSAQELAKSNEIELWDGEAVLKIFAGEFDFSEVFSV